MKKVLIVFLMVFLCACTMRMGAFAPRLPDISEHHELVRDDCAGCHDMSAHKDHKTDEDCLRCHHLIKGV